jgi:hypothetical protein
MLRKFFISSLIALMPIQSWAVLDMGFQHQVGLTQVVDATQESKLNAHPCHQESLVNQSGDSEESIHTESAGCNSCTLCMAFGLPVFFGPKLGQGDFSQRFFVSLETFQSRDPASLIKPPIL